MRRRHSPSRRRLSFLDSVTTCDSTSSCPAAPSDWPHCAPLRADLNPHPPGAWRPVDRAGQGLKCAIPKHPRSGPHGAGLRGRTREREVKGRASGTKETGPLMGCTGDGKRRERRWSQNRNRQEPTEWLLPVFSAVLCELRVSWPLAVRDQVHDGGASCHTGRPFRGRAAAATIPRFAAPVAPPFHSG